MAKTMPYAPHLAPELRELVRHSVAVLGEVLAHELGQAEYQRIESLREKMRGLRGKTIQEAHAELKGELKALRKLTPKQRLHTARAFTLMLEVMNACENAYRSRQIRRRALATDAPRPDTVIYVLTAHPTEARSPENIWIFHEILRQLTESSEGLKHSIELAWRTSLVRRRKPRVQDEAEHIYSTLLRDETLRTLLRASHEIAPIYIRSWVGGDKDGHSGVDEKVFLASLTLSRKLLLQFCKRRLGEVRETLQVASAPTLESQTRKLEASLQKLQSLKPRDINRVGVARNHLKALIKLYTREIGALHPSLTELKRLFHIFPALVVPLEFREASDVMMASPSGKGLAIFRMLKALGALSRGGDPRWYVRGMIISMASEIAHLQVTAGLVVRALGDLRLPIIPLFENATALENSSQIIEDFFKDRNLNSALHKHWGGKLEVMLGYSDSSKESGVLKSRLLIAKTMHRLDHLIEARGAVPLFFQGSGGSTDRGGGSIAEQTSWWSSHALRNYKVTIQGEMVERSLANPEITRGQIERIIQSAGVWSKARDRKLPDTPKLDAFAARVADFYKETVGSPEFLRVIEAATPYPFLDLLRFGSRPSKRTKTISVGGLRAIPWILCWTQTRVLFPTWWGVGHAWSETPAHDRAELLKAAKTHPVFSTYVRALGYTLAKVELPIWRLYLEQSKLAPAQAEAVSKQFETEYREAVAFTRAALGTEGLIDWRPWLQESITLRSPMIHPLNLLQLLAIESKDVELLRISVVGISSGMMTTG